MNTQHFESGDPVTYRGKDYDFAYYSKEEGWCILYEKGCKNMQDSFAIKIDEVKWQEHKCRPIWHNVNGTEPDMHCVDCGRDLG